LFPNSTHYARWAVKGKHSSRIVSRVKDHLRQGSVKTLKVERLCAACNSVWRGQAENNLKPLLTALFNGNPLLLTEERQQALAEYLTAKILTLDWMDGIPVTSLDICHAFYAERKAPPGYRLHIFNCFEGRWRSQFRGFGCILYHEERASNEPLETPNTKAFAIGFGNLFAYAVISLEVDLKPNFGADSSFRLWPDSQGATFWPPRYPINSDEAERIAVSLDQAFGFPEGPI
jgi:hypothetical protein